MARAPSPQAGGACATRWGASGSQTSRVDADYGRATINLFIKSEPYQFQIIALFRIRFGPLLRSDCPHQRDGFLNRELYIYSEHAGILIRCHVLVAACCRSQARVVPGATARTPSLPSIVAQM